MNVTEYLQPIFIAPHTQHRFGKVMIPQRGDSGDENSVEWFEVGNNLQELLISFLGPELACEVWHDIAHIRTPQDINSETALLGLTASTGGRKFIVPIFRDQQKYNRAIRLIKYMIHRYIPNFPKDQFGNLVLPEVISLAVKGTGAKNSVPSINNFSHYRMIEGYGAIDNKDVAVTRLISGLHEIDGEVFNLIPNRIHIGAAMLDGVSIYTDSLDFTTKSHKLPLATGDNQLAATAMIELFGPDIKAVKKLLNGLSDEMRVDYLRYCLFHHPFFYELCLREDLSSAEWLENYATQVIKHVYLYSRVAARYTVPGLNRSEQNTAATGLGQDFDDNTILEELLLESSSDYLLNFTKHFGAQLSVLFLYFDFLGIDINKVVSLALPLTDSAAICLAKYNLVYEGIKYSTLNEYDPYELMQVQLDLIFNLPPAVIDLAAAEHNNKNSDLDLTQHYHNRTALLRKLFNELFPNGCTEEVLAVVPQLIECLKKLPDSERVDVAESIIIALTNVHVSGSRDKFTDAINSILLYESILNASSKQQLVLRIMGHPQINPKKKQLIVIQLLKNENILLPSDLEFTKQFIALLFAIFESKSIHISPEVLNWIKTKIEGFLPQDKYHYTCELAKIYHLYRLTDMVMPTLVTAIIELVGSKNNLPLKEELLKQIECKGPRDEAFYLTSFISIFNNFTQIFQHEPDKASVCYSHFTDGIIRLSEPYRDQAQLFALRQTILTYDWPEKEKQVERIKQISHAPIYSFR